MCYTTLTDPTRSFRIRHVRRIKCRTEKIAFFRTGFFPFDKRFLHHDGRDVELSAADRPKQSVYRE